MSGFGNPKPRILVAEDNESDFYLLQEALREHHLDCDLALFEDGASALASLFRSARSEEPAPDLIILDLNLPRVDGRSLLKHLRGAPRFKNVPVLVWTSSTAARDREAAERLGADTHISKPSTLEDFMALGGTIKSLLEQSHARNGR